MRSILTSVFWVVCFVPTSFLCAQKMEVQRWKQDMEFAINVIADNYAYRDQLAFDWGKIETKYMKELAEVHNQGDFFHLIERLVDELHDHHAHLNSNDQHSFRLVPSQADIWVEHERDQYFVAAVKRGSQAEQSGVKAGDRILKINGISIDVAVKQRLDSFESQNSDSSKSWAARTLLAGRQKQKEIHLTLRDDANQSKEIGYKLGQTKPTDRLLTHERIGEKIEYIRIENSLGNRDLVGEFDRIIDKIDRTSCLILDLRNTPGGGNSDIARGLMGRLISKETPYQKHEFLEQPLNIPRVWVEYVRPRGTQFEGRLAVLCGRWTGSMGEGITIGLDSMENVEVIGTPMAGLRGATSRFDLPNSRIGIYLPTEKLFHVDGTPREKFAPSIIPDNSLRSSTDPCLETATQTLQQRGSERSPGR